MPIDFKNELFAGADDPLNFVCTGAVEVVKDFGMFNKKPLLDQVFKTVYY